VLGLDYTDVGREEQGGGQAQVYLSVGVHSELPGGEDLSALVHHASFHLPSFASLLGICLFVVNECFVEV